MSESRTILFEVPLIPTAKGRPRVAKIGNHARMFTPAATVKAEQEFVALAAPHAPETPIDAPIHLRLTFRLPVPASFPAWKREAALACALYPEGRPDVDNLAKLVMDAMNHSGRWWRDDSHVVSLACRKQYSATPGTRVEVIVMDTADTAAEWKAMQKAGAA